MSTEVSNFDIEERTIETEVAGILEYHRVAARDRLAMLDRAEPVLMKLPMSALIHCGVTDSWVQISCPSRDVVVAVLSALGAGKWKKKLSDCGDETKIDYEGEVDGVRVIIYGAEPPTTCRIIETEIEVPAHKAIKRELVCA